MKKYQIATGTVTYAIKGRDLLRKSGYKASIERKSGEKIHGCGYAIVIEGDIKNAVELLRNGGIKILETTEEK